MTTLSRRTLLGATAAVGASWGLTACGGFAPSGSQSTGTDTLTFTTWGTDAELAGFRSVIDRFQQANSGSTVTLNAVPYEQMFTNIDAQIQAGNPPDVFRVPYYTFGAYAGRGQLLDLSTVLPSDFRSRFTDPAWAAVQNGGKPYGVPHHTDTSAILYNKKVLSDAGITNVPTAAADAWTWDQFSTVAAQLRAKLASDRYPFVYNWQGNGVTRWLSLLFQAGGRFLAENLTDPAIDSAAGRATVEFTKGFFEKRFVPPNSSVKSTTYAADIWYSQTAAMTFGGAFLLPDADASLDFEWGATFSPRKQRGGGDFGGNALVATAGTKKGALAAKFLDFATQEQSQRDFCVAASLLPTRQDLSTGGITFTKRGDLTPVFLGQAQQVRAADAGQVASPSMSKIITVLKDQLELAFVGGQSVDKTVTGLSTGIASATAK